MKGTLWTDLSAGLQDTSKVTVDKIPLPNISDDEILVKMASASLCHSDLMLLEGSIPGNGQPVTIGHEGAGYVEKVGSNVTGYKSGDRIGFLYIKGCCCKFLLVKISHP
jgi:propanol-preferring alcohol dehydrogenase